MNVKAAALLSCDKELVEFKNKGNIDFAVETMKIKSFDFSGGQCFIPLVTPREVYPPASIEGATRLRGI